MRKNFKQFPLATRQLEYVALFTVELSTKEGPAYTYFAVDAYSEFAFHLGVENNDNPENILKYSFLLTENSEFTKHMHKGFTLVLEKYEEMTERINTIINPVKGKLIVNKEYNQYLALPVLKSLRNFITERKS